MNAALEVPKVAWIHDGHSDPTKEGKVELVYRALLLSVPLNDAARRLNLSSDHGMWPSTIYRELARMYVITSRGSVTLHPKRSRRDFPYDGSGYKSSKSLNVVFKELRRCAQAPSGVPPLRVAKLLLDAASLYRFPDPVLLGRLLDEVDAMVFRIVWSGDAASQ